MDEFHTFTITSAIIHQGAHANTAWWEMDKFVAGISNILLICIQVGFAPTVTMGKCPFMHIKIKCAAHVTILRSVKRSVANNGSFNFHDIHLALLHILCISFRTYLDNLSNMIMN